MTDFDFNVKNADINVDDVGNGLVTIECDVERDGVDLAHVVRFVHIAPEHLENRRQSFGYCMGDDVDADVTVHWLSDDIPGGMDDAEIEGISEKYCQQYLAENLVLLRS